MPDSQQNNQKDPATGTGQPRGVSIRAVVIGFLLGSGLAAIGYCFGGTCALELARSGAGVRGVVSFHGGLDASPTLERGPVLTRVLVCHGADDPHVPAEDLAALKNELREAGADWQLVEYGGAVHSFTNPDSGDDPSKGVAYNPLADARSWEHMRLFLVECFR